MIDYKWVINGVITQTIEDKENFVVDVYYELFADDGEFSSRRNGIAHFSNDTEQESFIPYKELTETQVLNWVQNQLGESEIERIKQDLVDDIEISKNRTFEQNLNLAELPWK